MKIKNKERNLKIVELFIEEHKTLNDIGKEFGLTRERIRQLLIAWLGRSSMKVFLVENRKFRKIEFDNATSEITCPNCGTIFKSRIKTKRYCSRDCVNEHSRRIANDPETVEKRRIKNRSNVREWRRNNRDKVAIYNQRSKVNRENNPVKLARHNKRIKEYNKGARERGIKKYGSYEAYKKHLRENIRRYVAKIKTDPIRYAEYREKSIIRSRGKYQKMKLNKLK